MPFLGRNNNKATATIHLPYEMSTVFNVGPRERGSRGATIRIVGWTYAARTPIATQAVATFIVSVGKTAQNR